MQNTGNPTEEQFKLQRFEAFINQRLRPDLVLLLDRRDAVRGEIAELMQLKTQIIILDSTKSVVEEDTLNKTENEKAINSTVLSTSNDDIRSLVNIGAGMFMQARIKSISDIYVQVGCGLHVKLTIQEAMKFINKNIELLNKRIESLTKAAADIRANISIVLEAMESLVGLENDNKNINRFK